MFREVCSLCEQYFYGSSEASCGGIRSRYETAADSAGSLEELGMIVNQMLSELKTSHSRFYTRSDPEYYQLLAIFKEGPMKEVIHRDHPDGRLEYPGIGILDERRNGRVFVKGVLEGSPAAQAGIKMGDQIVSVDGAPYHPIRSFEGKEDRKVVVAVQRGPNSGDTLEIPVTAERMDPDTLFLQAMKDSVRVIESKGVRIGYVHIWSYAGEKYQELLREEIALGRLRNADGLILDLRNGWGGATPHYLNVFNQSVPILEQIDRQGSRAVVDYQWRKPVVMLVNEGTRSGKEVLAYGFKKYGLGTIVGTKTAGAVMGARPFLLQHGSLLYLAVADVLVDGERLEGRGVVPHVEVLVGQIR